MFNALTRLMVNKRIDTISRRFAHFLLFNPNYACTHLRSLPSPIAVLFSLFYNAISKTATLAYSYIIRQAQIRLKLQVESHHLHSFLNNHMGFRAKFCDAHADCRVHVHPQSARHRQQVAREYAFQHSHPFCQAVRFYIFFIVFRIKG